MCVVLEYGFLEPSVFILWLFRVGFGFFWGFGGFLMLLFFKDSAITRVSNLEGPQMFTNNFLLSLPSPFLLFLLLSGQLSTDSIQFYVKKNDTFHLTMSFFFNVHDYINFTEDLA